MSLFTWIAVQPRSERLCRIAGLALFIVAFFLPACHDTDSSSLVHADRLMGWQCAWLSISMIFDSAAIFSPLFFAFLGGCINPLILIYLLLGFTKRFAKVKKGLVVAVLLCMVSTWPRTVAKLPRGSNLLSWSTIFWTSRATAPRSRSCTAA